MWQAAVGPSSRVCACARPAQVRADPSRADARATAGRRLLHFTSSPRSCIPDTTVRFMVSPLASAAGTIRLFFRREGAQQSVQCQPHECSCLFIGKPRSKPIDVWFVFGSNRLDWYVNRRDRPGQRAGAVAPIRRTPVPTSELAWPSLAPVVHPQHRSRDLDWHTHMGRRRRTRTLL